MLSFLVLEIYFLLLLLLLSGDGERVGWNHFLHSGFDEDEVNNYGISILTGLTTWGLLFSDGDIKVEMMSPP